MTKKKVTPSKESAAQGAKTLRDQIEKTSSRKSYVLDLKVNSPASLGYLGIDGLDSAPAIVRLSKVKGLDVIAITDLYSADFVDRLVEAATGSPLTVIPGVTIRCKVGACDDVVMSCLFPENTTTNTINTFLAQLGVPVSAKGRPSHILAASLGQIVSLLDSYQGVAIPTRIDKTPNRLAVLPELVEVHGFRAFDLAYGDSENIFKKRWPKLKFQLFSFSDANALAQIGSRIARVKMSEPGFAGIREIVARQQVS